MFYVMIPISKIHTAIVSINVPQFKALGLTKPY